MKFTRMFSRTLRFDSPEAEILTALMKEVEAEQASPIRPNGHQVLPVVGKSSLPP